MDPRERFDDPQGLLIEAIRGLLSSVWTCLPGSIVSFDPVTVTASVQIGVAAQQVTEDGNRTAVNFPVLTDVLVDFPRGGGCTFTFPIKAGDERLVFFACRAIDGWAQSGGIQPPNSDRRHSLADAFVRVGPMSQAKRISGISVSTAQLRSDDGSTYVELDPAGRVVNIVAPGGFNCQAPTANFSGLVTAAKDVTVGSISLKSHTHGKVQPGSGVTDKPQ